MLDSTAVLSLIKAGQMPMEWWMVLPGSGQLESTARIRLLPTTHWEYVHPSASTAQTRCREARVSRRTMGDLAASSGCVFTLSFYPGWTTANPAITVGPGGGWREGLLSMTVNSIGYSRERRRSVDEVLEESPHATARSVAR
jgi:hypothetical protein